MVFSISMPLLQDFDSTKWKDFRIFPKTLFEQTKLSDFWWLSHVNFNSHSIAVVFFIVQISEAMSKALKSHMLSLCSFWKFSPVIRVWYWHKPCCKHLIYNWIILLFLYKLLCFNFFFVLLPFCDYFNFECFSLFYLALFLPFFMCIAFNYCLCDFTFPHTP